MQQRLFEITYLLTAKGSATAGELAERFGVSRRTIYRDIDALSAAGIPIYTEKGKGGGIRLLPGFVLDKSLFSDEEKSQLLSHLQTLSALDIPGSQTTVDKVAALFGNSDSWLKIDFSPWGYDETIQTLFYSVKHAILKRNLLTFAYTGTNGIQETRSIEPYYILFKSNGWYVYGYCLTRQDFRYFKLTRMRSVSTEDTIFVARTIPKEDEPSPEISALPITLKFDPSLAFRVYDEFPAEDIEHTVDGAYIVRSFLPSYDWIYGYILSFGEGVEILEPLSLREETTALLQKMLNKYL